MMKHDALKKKRINKRILVTAAVLVVIIVIAGGIIMFRNYVSIRGQHLNTYSCSTGGGMTGGYHTENVKRYGDHALISIQSAEWHSQDPTVTEYLADAAVLDELEEAVRRYKMNFWNKKQFTKMFVHDGESTSYDFSFDDDAIGFSSQVYPAEYRKKLAELDSIVQKYISSAETLPGLVNPKAKEEENYSLPENELLIYVYSYAMDSLGLRILNGTDEDIEISEKYKIINADTDAVLFEGDTPYSSGISRNSRDEMNIRLNERLDAGSYKIIFDDLEIPFEIR